MRKIFFCDVDGTLLDGSRGMNEISPKTRYAIRELKKDHLFFIASGRCLGLMDQKIMDLDPDGYILCNGAYALFRGRKIYSESFSKENVRRIKEVTKLHHGFTIMETLNEMYIDSFENEAFKQFMRSWGAALDGFQENDTLTEEFHIGMIGFLNDAVLDEVEKQLQSEADLFRHSVFSSFDVNVKGISKGYGVKKVLEYLQIAKEDSYAFGDGSNDLEMLQNVGHPVMMANSHPRLFDQGFTMAKDVLEDGFYDYLLSSKLIKPL